ncbi:hypothetical protein BGZ82_010652 [Podila clonocystis]|nr:hypothetical protein BGZ82_010652 [Podila clonocystis]
MTSSTVNPRGYFKLSESESKDSYQYYGNASDGSTEPVRIHPTADEMDNRLAYTLPADKLQRGLYYAVWSLSLANYDVGMFTPLGFTSMTWNKESRVDSSLDEIKVEYDEMQLVLEASKSTQGNVLVRAPAQIFVDESTTFIRVQLRAEYSKNTESWTAEKLQQHSLLVNYVDLHRSDVVTSNLRLVDDVIQLRGPGTALKTISVCHKDLEEPESATRPVEIDVSMINSTGTYAATLSYASTRAFLDLWKLEPSLTPDPKINQLPAATTSFPITRNGCGRPPKLGLAISHDGSQIAVFPSVHFMKAEGKDVPSDLQFRVYSYNPLFTPAFEDKKQPLVNQLQLSPATNDPWLKNFAGAGKFHFLSLDRAPVPSDQERFVASDGLSIVVYSTAKTWRRHLSLELTSPPDLSSPLTADEALSLQKLTASMIDGMRGPYFAWQATDKTSFSVWNLHRLELTTLVVLDEEQGSLKHVSFSDDGSLMSVVTANGEHSIFTVKTGAFLDSSIYDENTVQWTQFVSSSAEIFIHGPYSRPYVSTSLPIGYDKRAFLPLVAGNRKHIRSVQLPKPAVEGVEDIDPGAEKAISEPENKESEIIEADLVYLQQGSTITAYSLRKMTFDSFWNSPHMEKCTSACESGATVLTNKPRECTTPTGLKFRLELGERTWVHNGWEDDVTIAILYLESTGSNGVTTSSELQRMIHFDEDLSHDDAYFLPCKTRFLIWGPLYFQIWELPREAVGECTLVMMQGRHWDKDATDEDIYEIHMESVQPCPHGHTIRFKDETSPATRSLYIQPYDGNLVTTDVDSCISSIPFILDFYDIASTENRKSLIKYVCRHINMRTSTGCSVMYRIVESEMYLELSDLFLKDLLDYSTDIQDPWMYLSGISSQYNPILLVLGYAQKTPHVLSIIALLIEYCTRQAKAVKSTGHLTVIFEALPELVKSQPDLALQAIQRCAFVPIQDYERKLIVRHARVRPRPSLIPFFEKKGGPHLSEVPEPVFQIRNILPNNPSPIVANGADEGFVSDIFVAPYRLLWAFDEPVEVKTTWLQTNWITAFFTILGLKLKVTDPDRVHCHELGDELFDNPAISALLEYKWNTFASAYWKFRFISQCIFYLLVLTVSFFQVYYSKPSELYGTYFPIVVLSAIFLWLEFQQGLRNPVRYITSPYNILDVIVYALPLAGGTAGIVQGAMHMDNRATRIWSFAILFIYIHILFELRVFKSVCKTVTIIVKIVGEIKVFFFIFAASIVAFTHTFLHLLWARTSDDTFDDSGERVIHHAASANYPRHPMMALSATYFFMSGRLDPVSDLFSDTDTWFHVMMIFYSFFTVILMLNVLIALVNVAFNTGDESWRIVWHESRARFIENAENMTVHIPGFRKTHSWFPNTIYYTATQKEVQAYELKYYREPVTSQFVKANAVIPDDFVDLRNFVAAQLPLRPLNRDDEDEDDEEEAEEEGGEKEMGEEDEEEDDEDEEEEDDDDEEEEDDDDEEEEDDDDAEEEDEEEELSEETSTVLKTATASATDAAVHTEQDKRYDARELTKIRQEFQQGLEKIQAQTKLQQEEASRREEGLQKQLRDMMALLQQMSPSH